MSQQQTPAAQPENWNSSSESVCCCWRNNFVPKSDFSGQEERSPLFQASDKIAVAQVGSCTRLLHLLVFSSKASAAAAKSARSATGRPAAESAHYLRELTELEEGAFFDRLLGAIDSRAAAAAADEAGRQRESSRAIIVVVGVSRESIFFPLSRALSAPAQQLKFQP